MLKRLLIPVLVLVTLAGSSRRAIAHGANIDYHTTSALQIIATYDSGTPMAEAQVVVYSPEDPTTAWLTGTTDENGRFLFTPDPEIAGTWEVQVRQAGHGDIIAIPVNSTTSEASGDLPDEALGEGEPSSTGDTVAIASESSRSQSSSAFHSLSPVQKGLMGGAVIWGFVGTALYFTPRQPKGKS